MVRTFLLSLVLCGCASIDRLVAKHEFEADAQKAMACLRIEKLRGRDNFESYRGCDKDFDCQRDAGGAVSCTESGSSPRLARVRRAEIRLRPTLEEQTGCRRAEIKIVDARGDPDGDGEAGATICERDFGCAIRASRSATQYSSYVPEEITCLETEESEARLYARIAVDRLALETGCDKATITVDGQTQFTRGKETAYRLSACGSRFICTTAPGRTDCKPVLADSAPPPAAVAH